MLADCFTESDSDKDGFLTQDEYVRFILAMNAKSAEKGSFVDNREETHNNGYLVMNTIVPSQPGVSMPVFMSVGGIIMRKII